MLADMAYGVLCYRLLVRHAPLDEEAARSLAAELTRGGTGGRDSRRCGADRGTTVRSG
jgi:hypothetical protein